jgi:hypothetical protein
MILNILIDDVCDTCIGNLVYWALKIGGEATKHKVIHISTDK